jgi:hypothetical protein
MAAAVTAISALGLIESHPLLDDRFSMRRELQIRS